MNLETDRLLVRNWKPSDSEVLFKINSDPRVMEFLPACLSRSESDALIEKMQAGIEKNGFGFCAVEKKSDAALIGFVGLSAPSFEAPFMPCVEVGWRLGHEYWGNGFAPEAAKAIIELGFKSFGLEEIVSFTVPENINSRKVMKKLGFARDPEGDFEHPGLAVGHRLRNHVLYRLSKPQNL